MKRWPAGSARCLALLCVVASMGSMGAEAPVPLTPAAHLRFGAWPGPAGPVTTEWQWPAGVPRGGLLLQSGFARQCANLRGTAARLAAQGWATLCLQADMGGGAPDLAEALARALADGPAAGLGAAAGQALPRLWVLAGHSAGAWFAARVARRLVQAAPVRLAGLILVDPVAAPSGFDELLDAVVAGDRPVWAVLAPASRCNGGQPMRPALAQLAAAARDRGVAPRVRVVSLEAATHLDLEGEDTETLAVWLCGEGRPRPAHTEQLRALLSDWAAQMLLQPAPPSPSGSLRPCLRQPLAASPVAAWCGLSR